MVAIHATGINRHKLSDVSIHERTAVCSVCGLTRIFLKGGKPRCGTKNFCEENNLGYYIGISDVEKLIGKKPKKCPTCLQLGKMCIDHDHETKELRGWLCKKCNIALGYMQDDYESIIRLSEYIKLTKRKN